MDTKVEPESAADVYNPSIETDPETLSLLLKAHCAAERARADYWKDCENANDDCHDFFPPIYAFWKVLESAPRLTDPVAIAKYKYILDARENKYFTIEQLVMPTITLRTESPYTEKAESEQ